VEPLCPPQIIQTGLGLNPSLCSDKSNTSACAKAQLAHFQGIQSSHYDIQPQICLDDFKKS